MEKYLKYISLVIALIGAYFFIKILGGDESVVGSFIGFTKWILIITIIIVLIFSIINLIKNPKAMKKALFAIITLVIVYFISVALSTGNEFDIKTAAGVEHITSSVSKNVEIGIWASVILGAVAFFGFIFDSIKNLIK